MLEKYFNFYKSIAFLAILGGVLGLHLACQGKKRSSGGGGATSTTTYTATFTNTTTTTVTSTGTTSLSMDQCNSQGLAWIPVVNGGNSPAKCGDQLVSWCCSEEEVYVKFPSLKEQLQTIFADFESQNFKLYNCSSSGEKSYTLHFARLSRSSGTREYQFKTITDAYPESATVGGTCTKVTEENLYSDFDSSVTYTSTSTTTASWDNIKGIVADHCGGAVSCHSAGASGAQVKFDNNETLFRSDGANIKLRLQDTVSLMPPTGSTSGFTSTDRDLLIEFINENP